MGRLRHIDRFAMLAASLATTLTLTGAASAQPSAADAVTAQALFDDGKRLMAAGKYADACPKLEESERLDPGGGTIYALALCNEGLGKTATAWAYFNQALAEARKDRRADREAASSDHVRALEKRLTRVRLTVASPAAGLVVKRDGVVVGSAQWSTALPVDPKDYTFEASAPGKTPWRATVMASDEGKTLDVNVPPLADAPVVADAPATAKVDAPKTPPPTTPAAPAEAARGAGHDYTWGFVAGGVGVVALGVGAAFGVAANSKWKDATAACPGSVCRRASDLTLGDSARSAADASTVFVIVGGAAAVTSLILFLTAPESASRGVGFHVAPLVARGTGGIVIGGAL